MLRRRRDCPACRELRRALTEARDDRERLLDRLMLVTGNPLLPYEQPAPPDPAWGLPAQSLDEDLVYDIDQQAD